MAVLRLRREAMQTRFEFVLSGADSDILQEAGADALHELNRLEGMLTRFDPGSEVGQINALCAGASRHVHPDVMDCLLTALWVNRETDGAFDVCIADVMDCWRNAEGHITRDHIATKEGAERGACMANLVLDPDQRLVGVQEGSVGGACIDLGGIGKGFAIDRQATLLEERGVTDVLLHSESTILALGSDPEGNQAGWLVGVGGEWGKAAGCDSLLLSGAALSCSGLEVKGHHIMDPAAGAPATSHEAAWALSPSAAVSDALATAFMVMDTAAVEAYCRDHDGTEGFVVKQGTLLRFS